MKIHSDTLTINDLHRATSPGSFWICDYQRESSRSRAEGWKVYLTGSSPYAQNSHGKRSGNAATYDEWGVFLARLYALDTRMIAGPYKGVEDFNRQTEGKYVDADGRVVA